MSLRQPPRIYQRGHWTRVRRQVLERDGWRCRCGRPGIEVHHVTALVDGGDPYDPANLVVVCRGCHLRAHGGGRRPDPRWRRILRAQLGV